MNQVHARRFAKVHTRSGGCYVVSWETASALRKRLRSIEKGSFEWIEFQSLFGYDNETISTDIVGFSFLDKERAIAEQKYLEDFFKEEERPEWM